METRRRFMMFLVAATAILGLQTTGQQLPQRPSPPVKDPQDAAPDNPNAPSPEKRILYENEKDIKKKVDRLFDLATELKAEVGKTDSTKVLSLPMLKKAEEIEKLAHDIRNRAKGT